MKEEQNASSSANYDVELFHKASAHTKLFSIDGYSATDLQSWMPQVRKFPRLEPILRPLHLQLQRIVEA
jgi:hypothetical protein